MYFIQKQESLYTVDRFFIDGNGNPYRGFKFKNESQISNELLNYHGAQFVGGPKKLEKWIKNNIIKSNRRNSIMNGEQNIQVLFRISNQGKVKKINILGSVSEGTEESLIQIFKSMPDWLPAVGNNGPFDSGFSIPIKI